MKKLLLIAMAVLSLNAFALSVNVGASYQEAAYTDDTGIFDAISGSGKVDYDDPILAVNVEVTQGLVIGEIVSFTPQKVRVKYINNWNYTPGREEEYLTEPEWIVKKPLTLPSNSDINIE